jgi:drug/metabolite transporter (DMT)-like permease
MRKPDAPPERPHKTDASLRARSRAEGALLATTLIWGGTFTVVKLGMEEISPILLIAIRFLVASVVVLVLFRTKLFPITLPTAARGALLGTFLFLGFVAQNIGLTITTASKSAFITGMMVVFVPLLQIVVEKRAPKLGNILGIVLVCLGLWFLTSPAEASFNAGDALNLVCAVLFAVYIVYLDVISHDMTTERLVFLQMAATAVLSTITVVLFETPAWSFSAQAVGSMLYLTFLATVLTTWVQTRFQKDTTPTRAVIIFSVEPVIASVIAYFVLDERLGIAGMAGGALILAGVLLSELSDSVPGLNRSLDLGEP